MSGRRVDYESVSLQRVERGRRHRDKGLSWGIIAGVTALTLAAIVLGIFGVIAFARQEDAKEESNSNCSSCNMTNTSFITLLHSNGGEGSQSLAEILATQSSLQTNSIEPATGVLFGDQDSNIIQGGIVFGTSTITGDNIIAFLLDTQNSSTLGKRAAPGGCNPQTIRPLPGSVCPKAYNGFNVDNPQCAVDIFDSLCLKGNATITGSINLINGSITVNGQPFVGGSSNGTGATGPQGIFFFSLFFLFSYFFL